MLLIPAIDIKDGQCVRLSQGDLDAATVYGSDPARQAQWFVAAGAKRIHIVDLNGAVQGKPVNTEAIARICRCCPDTEIQIGGGIRTADTAKRYLDMGAKYVIVGTRAVERPAFVTQIDSACPGSVIAGIDVRRGAVATQGWLESAAAADAAALALELANRGAVAVVYTDIEKDGMLSGVNCAATAALATRLPIPVIASGGIRDRTDIVNLMQVAGAGISGAIAGRSLYEGTLDYAEAVQLIKRLTAAAER